MVWRDHDDTATGLGTDGTPLRSKMLSLNEETGARSVLVRLPAGWSSTPARTERDRFLVSVRGTMVVDGRPLPPCSLVRIPVAAAAPQIDADGDVELLVKVGATR